MKQSTKRYVLCISNQGYQAALEPRKVYEVLADEDAAACHLLRVIDESGEDYLYDSSLFVPIEVPQEARRVFRMSLAKRQPLPTPMKNKRSDEGMLPEYDFSQGVRGKYAKRCAQGSNMVVIAPDVAEYFPDHDSVNEALRSLTEIIKKQKKAESLPRTATC